MQLFILIIYFFIIITLPKLHALRYRSVVPQNEMTYVFTSDSLFERE